MKIPEELCISLELAKKMKAADFPQTSWFVWAKFEGKEWELMQLSEAVSYENTVCEEWCAAPTAEEIIDVLPEGIRTGNQGHHTSADLLMKRYSDGYYVQYESWCCGSSDTFLSKIDMKYSEAAGMMWLCLKEEKLFPTAS
jgi:hypothetical protein